jgi:Ca2+-binding RTX toxin-like protein
MKHLTWPARAARAVTAAAAAVTLSVGAASAASAVTTDYHPTQESRDFADSAGGWTAEATDYSALACVPGLICPSMSNTYVATDGVGGAGDGFIRTQSGPTTVLSLLNTTTDTWTSQAFTYQGINGYAPDSLAFSISRRVDAGALLALLSGAQYRVVLDRSGGPAGDVVLTQGTISDQGWTTASAVAVDPADLTVGATYQFRVITQLTSTIALLPSGTFDYDNVLLRADATDTDGDGVPDTADNCDGIANPGQTDTDHDGIGDACDSTPTVPDLDTDGDGVPDVTDNCDTTKNPNQSDKDKDGIGDACDSTPNGPDTDGDGVPDKTDNCVNVANSGQSDKDGDGVGDACDTNPTGPNTSTCQGAQAQVMVGQSTGETLRGTDANDLIKGEKGNDRIVGKGGNDCLKGGAGKDTMRGQGGKDVLSGNAGRDVLTGENGNDKLRGQAGNDKLKGARDNDKLNGGKGKDRLNGGVGNDLLLGGNDADRLNGGKGKDVLNSGRGNDWIYAFDRKADVIRCGGGIDRVVVDAKDKVSVSCEKVLVRS